MRIWSEVSKKNNIGIGWLASANEVMWQEELLEGFKREGIDTSPYYWYMDQVREEMHIFN